MRPIDWAIEADQYFRTGCGGYTPQDFDLPQARVFYVTNEGHITSHRLYDNIYDGLAEVAQQPIRNCLVFGIETCGWASPISTNGQKYDSPYDHPDRRRVRVISVVDKDFDLASFVVFKDDWKNPLCDEDGEATGSLKEGVLRAMVAINIHEAMQRTE